MTATVTAHPHLQALIAEKQAELAHAQEFAAAVFDGLILWDQVDETLTCPDRQDAAYEIAASAVDQAKRELAELEAQAGEVA